MRKQLKLFKDYLGLGIHDFVFQILSEYINDKMPNLLENQQMVLLWKAIEFNAYPLQPYKYSYCPFLGNLL